jgi:hypothetical protein
MSAAVLRDVVKRRVRQRPALVDAVGLYFEDPARARAHGVSAREEGRTRWAETRFLERLLGLYREIAGS